MVVCSDWLGKQGVKLTVNYTHEGQKCQEWRALNGKTTHAGGLMAAGEVAGGAATGVA
ncbi:MAG: hypothetical protein ACOYNY_11730 [Caldilineaceae bacterium]